MWNVEQDVFVRTDRTIVNMRDLKAVHVQPGRGLVASYYVEEPDVVLIEWPDDPAGEEVEVIGNELAELWKAMLKWSGQATEGDT